MVEFDANLVYDDGENVIGWDVIVTSEAGDVIGSVAVTDQTTINSLRNDLEEISESIVSINDILDLLTNANEDNVINATKLSGIASDGYAKTVHSHDDRYFTESEVNALLLTKSNANHNHVADDITDLNSNLEFASVYGAPSSAFDASNINKEKTHSFTAYKLGNIVMYKFNFTTLSFTSGVVGSDRNVITTLPNFVQSEGTWRIHAINAGGSAPCLVSVGNGLTIRPYVATAYAVMGSGFYVAKNTDLE